ncbi:hypothetical protein H3U87_03015 [Bifidobacterium sp. W8101]|uniref:hypothetical protein n=1 Tax=Bifidobacterium TaxID=1678 RepID=UPI0018DB0505|nr:MULTISPECIES: hypothetical protein [Bifidobacterium]MBI0126111.1 hypothetical protein [Bifidobacterium choladohabitans]MBI0127680.1 hypothetical protein [Bifidobacterium sp. W8103]MBI0138268.1 hypothetical protein [Bifidobacterium sp. W8105]MBI0148762.1 hypothetical protein [Bifidobacterium sp. W8107]
MSYTSEGLDAMADRGELKPEPGTTVYRDPGAPALTDKDLMGIFAGRPAKRSTDPPTWNYA